MYILTVSVTQNLIFHGPINSLFKKQFYENYDWEEDVNNLIQITPKKGVISANNSLLPHLSQRENFMLFPKIKDAQYIAIDLSEGPNKFAPISYEESKLLIDNLIIRQEYKVIWRKNQAILLEQVE